MKDFFRKTFDFITIIGLCLVLTIVPVDAAMPDGTDTGQGTNPDDPTQVLLENELSEEIEDAEEDDESENDKKSSDKSEKTSDKKNTYVDAETESETPEGLSVTPTGAEAKTNNTVAVTEPKSTETNNTAPADGEVINTSKNENVSDESGKTSGENELSENTEETQLSGETTSKVNDTKSSETDNQGTEADVSVLKENTLDNSNQAQTTETKGEELLRGTASKTDSTLQSIEAGESAADKTRIEGIAYIPSSGNSADNDLPVRYVYSDKYFEESSIIKGDNFNYDLAALSAIVANCSGYSSRAKKDNDGNIPNQNAAENQSKNIQTILREIGFENIEVSADYTIDGNPFTTAVLCATKKINVDGHDYTVLGIFPRSFGYTMEWANNGRFGASGDAQGPSENMQKKIIGFVKDEYLTKHPIQGDLKIWSTGVSRGGGLSMLTSAYIDNQLGEDGTTDSLFGIEDLNLTQGDVYTYTFGAPNWGFMGNTRLSSVNPETEEVTYGDKNPLYNNIHNFAAEYDILYKLFSGGNWGLEHYGYDNILLTDKAKLEIDRTIQQYKAILQTDPAGVDGTGFFVDDGGVKTYKPFASSNTFEYDADGDGTTEVYDLAKFLTAYMNNVTTKTQRQQFAENQEGIEALLTVFLGQRNKLNAFKNEISTAVIDESKDIITNALKILFDEETGGAQAAIDYIKERTHLTDFSAGVITTAFTNVGIKYDYDYFKRGEVTGDDPDVVKEKSRELYAKYLQQIFNEVVLVGLSDIPGAVQMYKAAGNLWSAHDVNIYASWMRERSNDSEYYLKTLNQGEIWGYRMVYLPDSEEGFEIKVYLGNKDKVTANGLDGAILDGTIRSGKYYREDGFDPYVHIGFDLNGNKVLYLRSDQEYILEFTPQAENVDAKGLKIDEFNYEKYYEIFRPLHTITADDNKTELEQIGQLISEGNYSIGDKLYLEIGGINFEIDTNEIQKAAKMLKAASATEAVSEHEAEYYLLAKLIELVGTVENKTGGKVNSLDYFQTKMLINDPNGVSATLNASPLDGYRFLGWYTQNGTFVSGSLNFTKYFNFNDSSAVYYARFERIPDENEDSKPAPNYIPTDGWNEINIPVEVTSLAPARTYRIPKTADKSRLDLWIMFFASLTAAVASMYLLKETE